jgi:beclin 1
VELDETLSLAEVELRRYEAAAAEVAANEPSVEACALALEDVAALEREEEELLAKLQAVEAERESLRLDLEAQDRDDMELKAREDQYWHSLNAFEAEAEDLHEEIESLKRQTAVAEESLSRLSKTNVCNDTFHIWYSGHLGTINGFRLGRLPGVAVDWAEINAAYGQAALALFSLANRSQFSFRGFKIVPMGSFTKIAVTLDNAGKTTYDLYNENMGLSKLYNKSFDRAQVGFLACMAQFCEHVQKMDKDFRPPYPITLPDKIGPDGGVSICYHFNTEEKWCRALKFMLSNLKLLLFFVCK